MSSSAPTLLDEFSARGLVHDTTDRAALGSRLAAGPVTAYVGFDPTADSLHVGHLLGQLTLRRLQLAGHRPIALAGGATGMIGDPSGRSEERNLLDESTLRHNVERISGQLERLLDFDPALSNRAKLVDNHRWTAPVSVLDFLRDVGKHVTVNQMVAKESVRSRMQSDTGLSYTEFSYMLLQAFDFRWLCEHEGCELQMGGSDQWGNITVGVELIRKTLGRSVHGLTWPLLLKADGTKFGKTAAGAVWLDPTRTSPFQFRQFWFQTADADIASLLRRLSFTPLDDLAELERRHRASPERRLAQRHLAVELTTLVHGEDASRLVEAAAELLFGAGDIHAASVPELDLIGGEVGRTGFGGGAPEPVVPLLVRAGLAASNGDARRGLTGREFSVNGRRLAADDAIDDQDLLHGRFALLRRGKRFRLLDRLGGGW